MVRRSSRWLRASQLAVSSREFVAELEARRLFAAAVISSASKGVSAATAAASSVYIPKSDRLNSKAGETGHAYTQYQVLGHNPAVDGSATPMALTPVASGKTPVQIRTAYELTNLVFGSVSGDGAGQTIAIVDAYDNPSFVSSTAANFASSDLARFDAQFGLADPPSFTKIDQRGGTSYPAFNSGWAGEIALDVEWAHVMAPKANIILVEADNSLIVTLAAAVAYAKTIPGVTAITMSYGSTELSPNNLNEDPTYVTPDGHDGVTFFASTGDHGSPGTYPAYSPNVVAVGGTSLTLSGNTYASETGWSGSGGGTSSFQPKPAYQSLVTTPSAIRRTIPDVSILGNPNTGVNILDTSSGGIGSTANWYVVGGTSLSSPMWAGLMAVANQGRALEGLPSMAGPATQTRLYTLNASDYHDVTSGNNGNLAGLGYDLVTGRGTPRSGTLIPHLAGGNLTGSIFTDFDGDGALDGGEAGLSGITVYADVNNNSTLDANEVSATTDASGAYGLDVAGGFSYVVRAVGAALSSYIATNAVGGLALGTVNYGLSSSLDMGFFPKAIAGSVLTARLDAAGSTLQIFTGGDTSGAPAYSIAKSLLGATPLTFNATAGADLYTFDLTNGTPLPDAGLAIAGATVADAIAVLGTDTADTVALNAGAANFGGPASVTFDDVGSISVSLLGGDDRLDLNALSSSVALAVDPGAGADTIALGTSANTTDAILGSIALPASSSEDTLIVNDSASAVGHTYVVTGDATTGSIDSTDAAGGAVTFGAGLQIQLTPGTADDLIDVTPSAAFSLNVIGDALVTTDDDRLRVRAAANSGFALTPDASSETGTYTFTDARGSIDFSGIEHDLPLAVTSAFDLNGSAPAVVVQFTGDVSASLDPTDLVVTNLADSSTLSATAVTFDPLTNTARFEVTGFPDANYSATLSASLVTNAAGDEMVLDAQADFFVLAGDINHDRVVDFNDLVILAQNYNQTGRNFSQANLDYSADGLVDFNDLVIFAQHYNASLPALLASMAGLTTPTTAATPTVPPKRRSGGAIGSIG